MIYIEFGTSLTFSIATKAYHINVLYGVEKSL